MELTRKQKIYILNQFIRYYSSPATKLNIYYHYDILHMPMCRVLLGILENDLNYKCSKAISHIFPEFTIHNPNKGSFYWFPYGDAQARLEYVKMIKEKYFTK